MAVLLPMVCGPRGHVREATPQTVLGVLPPALLMR